MAGASQESPVLGLASETLELFPALGVRLASYPRLPMPLLLVEFERSAWLFAAADRGFFSLQDGEMRWFVVVDKSDAMLATWRA
jgi:hypothetical protein